MYVYCGYVLNAVTIIVCVILFGIYFDTCITLAVLYEPLCGSGYLNCDDVMCHDIFLGFWLDAMMAGGLWPGTRPS